MARAIRALLSVHGGVIGAVVEAIRGVLSHVGQPRRAFWKGTQTTCIQRSDISVRSSVARLGWLHILLMQFVRELFLLLRAKLRSASDERRGNCHSGDDTPSGTHHGVDTRKT